MKTQRFVSEPVSQNELADSQANDNGRLPHCWNRTSGGQRILNLERFILGLDYYQRYAERVQAVTCNSAGRGPDHIER